MSDVRKKCVEIFSKVMEVDPGVIHDGSNPENLEEWDSLAHVQIIAGLEEVFGIEIDPEEGIELESFRMVCDFVEKKLQ